MDTQITLINTDGEEYSYSTFKSFYLKKESYTPYTFFEAELVNTIRDAGDIKEIKFLANGNLIHDGICDSLDFCREKEGDVLRVKSKGFTSLLCQNQPEPGMKPNITLAEAMSEYTIPFVTYERTKTLNYIYITDGSDMWDTAANFAFRLNGSYPYIEGANHVRVTLRNSKNKLLSDKDVVKYGISYDFTKVISHYHMMDTEGTYNVFNQSSQKAIDTNIIRHKQIPLDMKYLNDPDTGLLFKLNFSQRGKRIFYVEYNGYSGEDLNDTFSYREAEEARIKLLEIRGGSGGVTTLLGTYTDAFSE